MLYLALNTSKGYKVKVCCSNCDYFEVWSKGDDAIFFYCKNEYCRKWTWRLCKLSFNYLNFYYPRFDYPKFNCSWFNYPSDMDKLMNEEREYIYSGVGHQEHFKWIKYKSYVEEISKIWERQNKRYCPNWGKGGRKDYKWTHITWKKCDSMFCYVWEALINKDNKFEHNDIDLYIIKN